MTSNNDCFARRAALPGTSSRVWMGKAALITAGCLSVGMQAAAAAAQEATEPSSNTATAAGQSNQRLVLEEVVVTARKRDENLRDIPIAVTALSATDLEKANIQNGQGLFGSVPGLYASSISANAQNSETRYTMRGVGARAPLETSVAVFIDGVYMPSVGWDMDFLEVERVEVLRGPQGALFGRNTQAGAINIVTRKPQREFGGHVRANFDEFNTQHGDAYLTGAFADSVRFSATALVEQSDGFVENVTRGGENALENEKYGGRLALRFEPTERFDATLFADGVFRTGGWYGNGEPLEGQSNRAGDYEVVFDQAPYETVDNYGGSLNLNFDAGFATLSSITGWRRISAVSLSDRDDINTPDRDGLPAQNVPASILEDRDFPPPSGNYLVIGREQSLISQEIRLTSNTPGRLQWLLGLYGFDEENDRSREQRMADCFVNPNPAAQSCVPNPNNHVSDNVQQDRDGYAVFGQATYDLTDRLELALGGRYTNEKDTQDLFIDFFSDNRLGPDTRNTFTGRPEAEFSDFTPSGSLTYRWNADVMTYLTVAEGFKGGGFTPSGPAFPQVNLAFDSETSVLYELGLKSSFLDRRLTLDTAVYWIDTTDMQVQTTLIIPGTTIASGATTNAGKARSRGFELELAAAPVQRLKLKGVLGYVDSEYVEYVADPRLTPSGVPVLDLSGEPIEEIPDWTGYFSADYTMPVSASLDLTFGGSYRYIGKILQGNGTTQSPHVKVDAYDNTDVRVALNAERWDLTLYANNVFDEYNISNNVMVIDAFRTFGLYGAQRPEPPRRIGLRATYRF